MSEAPCDGGGARGDFLRCAGSLYSVAQRIEREEDGEGSRVYNRDGREEWRWPGFKDPDGMNIGRSADTKVGTSR